MPPTEPSLPLEITPQELQSRRTSGQTFRLIDVRELEEHAVARIQEAELVPMGNIPAKLQYLEGLADEQPLALFCHHGVRSLNVAVWLRHHGIENCASVTGGIDRWSLEIDHSVPRY